MVHASNVMLLVLSGSEVTLQTVFHKLKWSIVQVFWDSLIVFSVATAKF